MPPLIDPIDFNASCANREADASAGAAPRCGTLAAGLGLMAAGDAWLVLNLARALETSLAQPGASAISALAAAGCAAMTGVALLLSWLLAGDLIDTLRRNSSPVWHNF